VTHAVGSTYLHLSPSLSIFRCLSSPCIVSSSYLLEQSAQHRRLLDMRVSGGTHDVVDGEERQLLYTILDTFERTLYEIERSKYCVVVDVSVLDEAAQGPALGIGKAMGGDT